MASTYAAEQTEEKKIYKHDSSGLRRHANDSILLYPHNGIWLIGIRLILFLGFIHRIIFIEIRRLGSRAGFRNVVFL
jgi:hypothetical protein